jgi:hypothetical protein
VAWTPGSGGKSDTVVAMAWIPGFFIAGEDGHPFALPRRLGRGFFQDFDLTINAQNLRHLLLELGVAVFKIVTHLVRLDLLFAEYLAHRALDQSGQTPVPCRRAVFARMACQQPRRPKLMRIAVFLGFVACQRYQPGFGLRRDRWFLARPRSIIECRQRAIGERPLDAALYRLMMDPKSPAHCAERRMVTISQQDLRPRYTARQLRSRPRKSPQCCNLFIAHRQFDRLPPSRHDAAPRFANRKQGIHQQPTSSMAAGFMESVV